MTSRDIPAHSRSRTCRHRKGAIRVAALRKLLLRRQAKAVADRDDFLSWVKTELYEAELALGGDS